MNDFTSIKPWIAAVLLALSSAPASALERVMLTAFEPFGGSATNRSYDVALEMKKQLEKIGIQTDICLLPVVYDAGPAKAKTCYEKESPKPDLVMSMGEAGCAIQMETAGINHDGTPGFPDNAGVIRTGNEIIPGGPAKVGFRDFVASMYCSAPPDVRRAIDVSVSPGGFVCNNVAFTLGSYFEDHEVPYTFIHVPNSRCSGSAQQAAPVATTLTKMVMSYSHRHPLRPLPGREKYRTELCERLPTTKEQAVTVAESIAKAANIRNPQCSLEFGNRLKSQLEMWSNFKDQVY